jgi:hypothetical protein
MDRPDDQSYQSGSPSTLKDAPTCLLDGEDKGGTCIAGGAAHINKAISDVYLVVLVET